MKVILVGATTMCGRISPSGYSSLLDRRRLEEARERTQASIMGANTLRMEDPEMRTTNGTLPQNRTRAIISQSGNIPVAEKKLFAHGPEPVVFTAEENVFRLQSSLQGKGVTVGLPKRAEGLSLQSAVNFLAEKGVREVLIEGGSKLNYSALAQGIVDEILLTVMPFVSGDSGAPAFADGPESLGEPFMKFELISCDPVSSGELFLHYRSSK